MVNGKYSCNEFKIPETAVIPAVNPQRLLHFKTLSLNLAQTLGYLNPQNLNLNVTNPNPDPNSNPNTNNCGYESN